MRRLIVSVIMASIFALTSCASSPVAGIRCRVMDDAGNVVTGAVVEASTWMRNTGDAGRPEVRCRRHAMVDTNGVVALSVPSKTGQIQYQVPVALNRTEKLGQKEYLIIGGNRYYPDAAGGQLRFNESVAGEWQTTNSEVKIVLKRVIRPKKMLYMLYEACKSERMFYNGAILGDADLGYDLFKADFVAPYGKGERVDLIFKLEDIVYEITPSRNYYYYMKLTIRFPNDGDGIQVAPRPEYMGSSFDFDQEAPADGYRSIWSNERYSRRDGNYYEEQTGVGYYFRIRTEKDKEGNIGTAYYGRFCGPIVYNSGQLDFIYYINPTSNDRGMECAEEVTIRRQ